jgi:hypothetical protein
MPESHHEKCRQEHRLNPPGIPVAPVHLERIEDIIQYPVGERDMPPAPEFRLRSGGRQTVEVPSQSYVEQPRTSYRDVGIGREIRADQIEIRMSGKKERKTAHGMHIPLYLINADDQPRLQLRVF